MPIEKGCTHCGSDQHNTTECPMRDAAPAGERETIRAVFLRNGFTVKEGHTDLKPYVYAAAEELLSIARASWQRTQAAWVPDALREAVEYLDDNPFNEIGAGSILHRAMRDALAAAPAQPAAQAEFGDAYQGAREDLAIWKRRALEAEQKIRHQEQIIDQMGEDLNAINGQTFMGEPVLPASPAQSEVQRLRVHVCKLGRYGAAFDPASTHYAYTYTDQPDNLGAGKLGRAALGINPGGDVIDAGLSLLDRLSREGFGVFQIAASTGQEVEK